MQSKTLNLLRNRFTCTTIISSNVDNCPCGVNCPNGCPCSSYKCPAALVLHNNNNALVTNIKGDRVGIEWNGGEDISAYSLCSLTFQNKFYVFGQV